MASEIYFLLTLLLFFSLIWASWMFYKNPSWALAMLLPLESWLIFDPLVISLGNPLGEGSLLQVLTFLRYLLRTLLTPFLIIVAFDQAKRAGVKWVQPAITMLMIWMLVVVLIIVGFVTDFARLDLEIKDVEGIKRYIDVSPAGFPFAGIFTMLVISILGVFVMRQIRSIWLPIGGVIMAASVLGGLTSIPGFILAGASVVLVICFLITEKKLQKIAPNPAVR